MGSYTDISERGLATLIMCHMTGTGGITVASASIAMPSAPHDGSE